MSPELKAIINDAQGLTPLEQATLISTLSNDLQKSTNILEMHGDFWHPKTLEQHYKSQHISPSNNTFNSANDFWPKEENMDDFINFLDSQRNEV